MYNQQTIETYLRNYSTLEDASSGSIDDTFRIAKMDLDESLKKLKKASPNLYETILGVFVFGNPIQEQAKRMKVSKRQTIRRMNDGLYMLTMIMNGEVL